MNYQEQAERRKPISDIPYPVSKPGSGDFLQPRHHWPPLFELAKVKIGGFGVSFLREVFCPGDAALSPRHQLYQVR
jgi:hypothetical protein